MKAVLADIRDGTFAPVTSPIRITAPSKFRRAEEEVPAKTGQKLRKAFGWTDSDEFSEAAPRADLAHSDSFKLTSYPIGRGQGSERGDARQRSLRGLVRRRFVAVCGKGREGRHVGDGGDQLQRSRGGGRRDASGFGRRARGSSL